MTGFPVSPPPAPRKRFGQHFLHDQGVLARIVAALAPKVGERVVEIGPGLGALTLPLLNALGRLEVVELDRDIIPHLRERCAGAGELILHQADALAFDFRPLAEGGALRLAGNRSLRRLAMPANALRTAGSYLSQ